MHFCFVAFRNKTVPAFLNTKEITVGNLKSSTTYTVCLSVSTKGGTKTSDPYSARTLQLPVTVTSI